MYFLAAMVQKKFNFFTSASVLFEHRQYNFHFPEKSLTVIRINADQNMLIVV